MDSYTPSNHGDVGALKCSTPEGSVTPLLNSHVVRRRSVRIAKRRSVNQNLRGCSSPLLKDGTLPVPSVISPVSILKLLHVGQ